MQLNDNIDVKNIVYHNTMVAKVQIKELETYLDNIILKNIEGDIVECGTWRGGLACLMLYKVLNNNKKIFIYDTFEGMTKPLDVDISFSGEEAIKTFEKKKNNSNDTSDWCNASLQEVENNLNKISDNYKKFTKLIKGKVEDTLLDEKNLPEKISLIRLDTDWYESTKIELEIFYQKISKNGIIIVDDYYQWQGQKKAVDDFFTNKQNEVIIKKGQNTSLVIEKII